ncbi:MAG: ComEA family DNA-binding protein [Methylococcaceae bacterium]
MMKRLLPLLLLLFSVNTFAALLDINTATIEQLDEVMIGIGQVKAQAIVQYREKNGAFKSIDELKNIMGIGSKLIEKNRAKLTVIPPQAQKTFICRVGLLCPPH